MRIAEDGNHRRASKRPSSRARTDGRLIWTFALVSFAVFIFQIVLYERLSNKMLNLVDDLEFLPPRRLPTTTPFVFVHVPKAAGTTITESMKAVFRHTCYEVKFNDPLSVNSSLDEGERFATIVEKYTAEGIPVGEAIKRTKRWHDTPCFFTHAVAGPRFDSRQMLMNAVMNQGARFRYILGHVPFGYCAFAEEGCVYVTVLREPMSRFYSHYKYLMRTHLVATREMCRGKCEDFAGFVELAHQNMAGAGMDNMQTRMIAGDSFWSTVTSYKSCINGLSSCDVMPPELITTDTLAKAKYNLIHRFAVVGVMDHLSIFKKMMEEVFGMEDEKGWGSWAVTSFFNDNKEQTHDKFDANELDSETKQKLFQFQKYDIELYEFAQKMAFKQYADLTSLEGVRRGLEAQWEEMTTQRAIAAMQQDDIDIDILNAMDLLYVAVDPSSQPKFDTDYEESTSNAVYMQSSHQSGFEGHDRPRPFDEDEDDADDDDEFNRATADDIEGAYLKSNLFDE